jgi:hypothetical protein
LYEVGKPVASWVRRLHISIFAFFSALHIVQMTLLIRFALLFPVQEVRQLMQIVEWRVQLAASAGSEIRGGGQTRGRRRKVFFTQMKANESK